MKQNVYGECYNIVLWRHTLDDVTMTIKKSNKSFSDNLVTNIGEARSRLEIRRRGEY